MAEKTLDEQVNELARHFARLIVDKDYNISHLDTSGKVRLECYKSRDDNGGGLRLINKIDGIVETWAQASQISNESKFSMPARSYCKTCGHDICEC